MTTEQEEFPHRPEQVCWSCDETGADYRRNGEMVVEKRILINREGQSYFSDDIVRVREVACTGCMKFLDFIRMFSIPFYQTQSHRGNLLWVISRSKYDKHKSLFSNEFIERTKDDAWSWRLNDKLRVIEFGLSDGDGGLIEELIQKLVEAGKQEGRNVFKAKIHSVNIKSIRCEISSSPLPFELALSYLQGEEPYPKMKWIKATFAFKNTALHDLALRYLDYPILVAIQSGEVVGIQGV